MEDLGEDLDLPFMDQYIYKSRLIEVDYDQDDDCVKMIFSYFEPEHWEIDVDDVPCMDESQRKYLDISPYSGTIDHCMALIEMGNPTRESVGNIGPLRDADIINLWKSHVGVTGIRVPLPDIDHKQLRVL